jgi:hypothetical protein
LLNDSSDAIVRVKKEIVNVDVCITQPSTSAKNQIGNDTVTAKVFLDSDKQSADELKLTDLSAGGQASDNLFNLVKCSTNHNTVSVSIQGREVQLANDNCELISGSRLLVDVPAAPASIGNICQTANSNIASASISHQPSNCGARTFISQPEPNIFNTQVIETEAGDSNTHFRTEAPGKDIPMVTVFEEPSITNNMDSVEKLTKETLMTRDDGSVFDGEDLNPIKAKQEKRAKDGDNAMVVFTCNNQ